MTVPFTTDPILTGFRTALGILCGERLSRVVLFGARAGGAPGPIRITILRSFSIPRWIAGRNSSDWPTCASASWTKRTRFSTRSRTPDRRTERDALDARVPAGRAGYLTPQRKRSDRAVGQDEVSQRCWARSSAPRAAVAGFAVIEDRGHRAVGALDSALDLGCQRRPACRAVDVVRLRVVIPGRLRHLKGMCRHVPIIFQTLLGGEGFEGLAQTRYPNEREASIS